MMGYIWHNLKEGWPTLLLLGALSNLGFSAYDRAVNISPRLEANAVMTSKTDVFRDTDSNGKLEAYCIGCGFGDSKIYRVEKDRGERVTFTPVTDEKTLQKIKKW